MHTLYILPANKLVLFFTMIGYACLNWTLGCNAGKTFRLQSYSAKRQRETILHNLHCLHKILRYNISKGIYFFRISSKTIPFASHSITEIDWKKEFALELEEIGEFIRKHHIRISMHPDQFVLINSTKKSVVLNSIKELLWHAEFLDALKIEGIIQIHVGGVYNNKEVAIKRFIKEYHQLPLQIKKRLAIENDDRLYSLKDCLEIHKKTKVPVIFDTLHHELLHNKESIQEAIQQVQKTWKDIPMVDYSSQEPDARKGKHASTIDLEHFKKIYPYISNTDIMLEIKDKEKSALKAIQWIEQKT